MRHIVVRTLRMLIATAGITTSLAGCGVHDVVLTPMPQYYVTIAAPGEGMQVASLAVVVHDSRTGAATGSTAVPNGTPAFGADISGAANDQTFVVGATVAGARAEASYHLFRLHVSGRGVPGPITELRGLAIKLRSGHVTGIALSPDNRRLAVVIQRSVARASVFKPFAVIDVVDLRTMRSRSWRSSVNGYWAGTPSWSDQDTTLAFPWWHEVYNVMSGVDGQIVGFGQLNTADRDAAVPGRLSAPPVGLLRSVVFAPGSTRAVATACQESAVGTAGTITAQTGQISGLDSRQFSVFHSETRHFTDSRTAAVLGSSCAVLSVDPSGQHALVYGFRFGRLDGGVFTALPAVAESFSAAW
jgi:hypothetical protein